MPPRYSYWTIIAGGLPTAFRAADRDDLLPTFKRLQEKHPDAEMKWFARGRLWESPDAARADTEARRLPPPGHRPAADRRPPGERRGRDWRPGGEHRDPRQKFIDAKKDRNQDRRKQRFERKNQPPRERPHGDPLRRDVPPSKPGDGRAVSGPPRRTQQGAPHKREWTTQPPREQRDWRDRPPQQKRDWRDRPPREKPHGDPLRRDSTPKSGRPPGSPQSRPSSTRPFQARPANPKRPPYARGARGPGAPKPRNGGGGGGRKR